MGTTLPFSNAHAARRAWRPLLLIVLAAAAMPGCRTIQQGRQVRVTLTFENVRTFVDASGRKHDEWDKIKNIPAGYHVEKNIFGEPYKEAFEVKPSSLPGMELRDYTVTMVVNGIGQLGNIDRNIFMLNDAFGPNGERPQLAISRAAVPYRNAFVQAAIEITVRGQANPGATVRIWDHATGAPVEVPVGPTGGWATRVGVGEGKRFIYGTSTMPDAPRSPRAFRIDVFTRRQEDLDATRFEELRRKEP